MSETRHLDGKGVACLRHADVMPHTYHHTAPAAARFARALRLSVVLLRLNLSEVAYNSFYTGRESSEGATDYRQGCSEAEPLHQNTIHDPSPERAAECK